MMTDPYPVTGAATAPSRLTAMRLVAGREVSTRLHSKAFRVMTLIMMIAIVGMSLVFKLIGQRGPDTQKVGVTGASTAVSASIDAIAASLGTEVSVQPIADEAAGRADVKDGTLDALVTPRPGAALDVVVDKSLDSSLRGVLTATAQHLALDDEIRALGGNPAGVSAAMAKAKVSVQALAKPRQYDTAQLVLGFAAGILIYLSLMICGQWVAQGVVEEKSSRIVELLLAAVRPWELMTGKVAGIGLVGLIQVVLLGVVGVGVSTGMGTLSLSVSAAVSTVVWLVVWYLVGFVMYAFAFAGAGALVSRQEDAAGVVTPVLMFVIIGYVIGISVLPSNPTNTFAEVLSVIPLFAPTMMPIRLAMGGVPAWESALALVLALATIPLLAGVAARIYRNAVIHIGARVSLRTALARIP